MQRVAVSDSTRYALNGFSYEKYFIVQRILNLLVKCVAIILRIRLLNLTNADKFLLIAIYWYLAKTVDLFDTIS